MLNPIKMKISSKEKKILTVILIIITTTTTTIILTAEISGTLTMEDPVMEAGRVTVMNLAGAKGRTMVSRDTVDIR